MPSVVSSSLCARRAPVFRSASSAFARARVEGRDMALRRNPSIPPVPGAASPRARTCSQPFEHSNHQSRVAHVEQGQRQCARVPRPPPDRLQIAFPRWHRNTRRMRRRVPGHDHRGSTHRCKDNPVPRVPAEHQREADDVGDIDGPADRAARGVCGRSRVAGRGGGLGAPLL